ncbi:MAG TPA: TlpA family protein disulfide reductase [Thermoplasmata archaeon]|nr:TlpA family protein disulfide reductase [Thermoplasmata archaeon]
MKKHIFVCLILLSVLLFMGCTTQHNRTWGNAPDFTLPDLNGNSFTLSNLLGKFVVLAFVTTRCPYCLMEMEELEKVHNETEDNVAVVSIVMRDTALNIRNVYGTYVDKWVFLMDNKGVYSSYHVMGVPKIVIINQEGDIIYSKSGLTDYKFIMSKIKEAR